MLNMQTVSTAACNIVSRVKHKYQIVASGKDFSSILSTEICVSCICFFTDLSSVFWRDGIFITFWVELLPFFLKSLMGLSFLYRSMSVLAVTLHCK